MKLENIKSKEEILLDSITKYFYNNLNINKIIPIMTGNSNISLRAIDWFVTNYSSKFNINYTIKKKNNIINFNVYNSYKNQLKAYNKRFFDPFCRINKNNLTKRIIFQYDNDNYIQTTIGQINFFKWAIEYNIIDYVNENYKNICNDMNNKNIKNKKNNFNCNADNYNFKLIL